VHSSAVRHWEVVADGCGWVVGQTTKSTIKAKCVNGKGANLSRLARFAFFFSVVSGATGYFSASGHLTISQAQKAARVL
jgi:hypothetical protein